MKNISMMKKALSILMAAAMMFAMGANVLAAEVQGLEGAVPPDSKNAYCSTYEVEETMSTEAKVTFIIEAADNIDTDAPAFYVQMPVTLSSDTAKSFTVSDVLEKVAKIDTKFVFNIQKSEDTHKDNLIGVTYNNGVYEPDGFTMAGWEFRVNDLFPVIKDTAYGENAYVGTTIGETYVDDGDVIHFFWDDIETISGYDYSTNYIRLVHTVDDGDVTVQLQGQKVQYNSKTGGMVVNYYSDFTTSTVVTVYDANGDEVTHDTTNASGVVSFSGLASGEYTIKSASAILDDFDEPVGYSDYLLSQTTGYTTITVA